MKTLSAATIKELNDWAEEIVDHLATVAKNSCYQIQITLAPNPLNYDGMNSVEIDLVDHNKRFPDIKSGYQFTLPEAVEVISKGLEIR